MLAASRPFARSLVARYRGLLLNLAFLVYLLAGQPLVLRHLARVVDRSAVDGPLVAVFLAAAGLETAGLWLKAPGMQARLRAQERRLSSGLVWLAWMAHAMLGLACLMLAAQTLGIDVAEPESEWTGLLLMSLGAAVVIKELLLLFKVFLPLGARSSDDPMTPAGAVDERLARREAWGDGLIFPFSALGFSLLWDFVIYRTPFHAGSLALALLDLTGGVLVYAVAQIAARGIYLVEELSAPRKSKAWLLGVSLASLIVALIHWVGL